MFGARNFPEIICFYLKLSLDILPDCLFNSKMMNEGIACAAFCFSKVLITIENGLYTHEIIGLLTHFFLISPKNNVLNVNLNTLKRLLTESQMNAIILL